MLMTYKEIVDDYKTKQRSRDDNELSYFASNRRSFEEAVLLAGLAINLEGKRLDHMSRLQHDALSRGVTALIKYHAVLSAQADFHSLLQTIYDLLKDISHLGEMYWYDTAIRLGANLGLYPDHIYLHRGTREGAARVVRDTVDRVFIDVHELPPELVDTSLSPGHYESLLCVYKDELGGAKESSNF
jgi:hypothetical protein